VQQAGPDRVSGRVHAGQRGSDPLDRSEVRVDQVGRLGGPLQQGRLVDRDELGRSRHPIPQLQGALVVPVGLGQGDTTLCRCTGLDRRRQRPLQIAGRLPVVGELGRHRGTGATRPAGLGREGVGQRGVQPGPLTG